MNHRFTITEEQRQAVLLAVAELSLRRPGWEEFCLRPIAEALGGLEMYKGFRATSAHLSVSMAWLESVEQVERKTYT